MAVNKVSYQDLIIDVKVDISTREVEPLPFFNGQDRVERAFDIGLKVPSEGYNIFVAGPDGSGRTTYTRLKLEEISKSLKTPEDIVYYHNFDEPLKPKYLLLNPGYGKYLASKVDNIIERLKKECVKIFEDRSYEDEKVRLLKDAESKREEIFERLRDEALKYNLGVVITPMGINLMPIINGKIVTNIDLLSEEQLGKFNTSLERFEETFRVYLRQLREIDHRLEEMLKDLKLRVSNQLVDNIYYLLEEEFKEEKNVLEFIRYHKKQVIENIDIFVEYKITEKNPIINKSLEQDIKLFKLNVIVDNSNLKGAPVIFETNPTFKNLFGNVSYEAYMGVLFATHMNIVAGSLHRARGGFLVLYMKDLLKNPILWEAFKRTITSREINIGGNSHFDVFSLHIGIDPQPVMFDSKIVVIGNNILYELLQEYDPEFSRIFKIKAEFNPVKYVDQSDLKQFPNFIKKLVVEERLKDVSKDGIEELIKQSIVKSGSKNKINMVFSELTDILREANIVERGDEISAETIRQITREREYRNNLIEEKILELIKEGKIIIDTDGKKIGQVNGLSVYYIGGLSFGKPSRITASAYIGEKGIINIEREAELSGQIHDKGVLILTGFIGKKYGSDFPLTLSCSLTFEQSYGEVEGDSASAAEAIAILSEVGEIPVRQDIAITGSIDQHGNIQPVGGIKEKIEGFFKVCKLTGLTGKQGVIIPSRNIDNLVVDDEVVDAVKDEKFHIYTVDHIDDIIEIVSEMDAGSFHRRVKTRLEEFFRSAQKFTRQR